MTRSFMSLEMIKVIMQLLVFAAAAIAFSTFARAEAASRRKWPVTPLKSALESCECLRTGADKADGELATVVDVAIKSIDARQGLLSSQKARWRRSLNDAQAQWIAWRDFGMPGRRAVSNRAWTPRAAIRACVASSTTTRSAYRASRRAILELRSLPRFKLGFRPRESRLRSAEGDQLWQLLKAWAMSSIGLIEDPIGARTLLRLRACELVRMRARS